MSPITKASNAIQEQGPAITTTLVVLALIAGTVFLTWSGKVNGDAFVALASSIVGGVLVRQGVSQGSKSSADSPPEE